jgi:hypothetical protein
MKRAENEVGGSRITLDRHVAHLYTAASFAKGIDAKSRSNSLGGDGF